MVTGTSEKIRDESSAEQVDTLNVGIVESIKKHRKVIKGLGVFACGALAIVGGYVGVKKGLDFIENQKQARTTKKIEGILEERGANAHGVTVDVYGKESEFLSLGCENVAGLDENILPEERRITFKLEDGLYDATLILPKSGVQKDFEGRIIDEGSVTKIDISTKPLFNDFLTSEEYEQWCMTAFGTESSDTNS